MSPIRTNFEHVMRRVDFWEEPGNNTYALLEDTSSFNNVVLR